MSATRLLVLGAVRIFQPAHGYLVRRELLSWDVENWAAINPGSIYNMLRTADSVSPSLTGLDVLISLIGYVSVYLFVYPTGILLMYRIVRKGPRLASTDDDDSPVKGGRPDAPVIAGAVEQ